MKMRKTSAWRALGTSFCGIAISILMACGESKNLALQNPPPPPSTPVSIAFQPAPAGSISLAATTTLTAVVDNDPANLGVDWWLLCPANATCGALSTQHTASGAAVTYTPPPTISGNSQTFTIQAFAAADNTQNVVANVVVTGFASTLKGSYVFSTKGIDGNGPYQLAGVVVLDGNGGVTGGEQTHNDPLLSVSEAITGGSYYVGPDGRGSLTINTANQNIGQLGVENLTLVVLSNAKALIANLDDPNVSPQSFENSSGTLELQTSKSGRLSGGYAFAVSGTNAAAPANNPPYPLAIGGILNVDSPGLISGAGSIADEDAFDGINDNVLPNSTISGTVTNPDSFGSIKFNLTASFSASPIQLTGYIVDDQHMKLIESDNDGSNASVASTAGIAVAQGSATGTFTSNQAFTGTYVLGLLGQDFSGLPTSLASIGVLTADGSGNLSSGFVDEVVLGASKSISDSLTGTYTLDPSGTGRVDSQINFTKHEPAPEWIFYLTGNGNPPVVLSIDTTQGALAIGLANPQTSSKISFNGRYGMSFTQGVSASATETDSTAQITVDDTKGTLAGAVDSDISFNGQINTPLSGTFGPGSVTSQFSGTITDTFFPTPGAISNTLNMDYFLIDSTRGYLIEIDSPLSAYLTFGYFESRTPVCATCP